VTRAVSSGVTELIARGKCVHSDAGGVMRDGVDGFGREILKCDENMIHNLFIFYINN
jgi:hypothetical protein